MISAAVYSVSSQVRKFLRVFFKESQVSKSICCSGCPHNFFDKVILDTTQLAVIDISDMGIDAAGIINRILSYNPGLDILVIHFGSIDPSIRSSVASVGVSKITCFSSNYRNLDDIIHILAAYFADFIYALTSREQQVLRMISEGMKTIEIAKVLGISSTTVTVYRKKIAKKIGSNMIAIQTRIALTLSLTSF